MSNFYSQRLSIPDLTVFKNKNSGAPGSMLHPKDIQFCVNVLRILVAKMSFLDMFSYQSEKSVYSSVKLTGVVIRPNGGFVNKVPGHKLDF